MSEELFTANRLSELSRLDRRTVNKRLADVPPAETDGGLRRYRLKEALPRLCAPDKAPGDVSESQARKELCIARKRKIEVEDQILRRERIPLDDAIFVTGETFALIKNVITASPLSDAAKAEIFRGIHELGDKLRAMGPKKADE